MANEKKCQIAMGLETEYGFLSGANSDPGMGSDRIRGTISATDGGSGSFMANGARFYVDGDRPEYCTPECGDPWALVAHARAGDRLMNRWVKDNFGRKAAVSLASSSLEVDFMNNHYLQLISWGSHESYSIAHRPPIIARGILDAHISSRICMCGAGGLRYDRRSDRAHADTIVFSVAPRMERFEIDGIDGSLFGYKDDRLHIKCGESLCSDWALFLKFASTALIIHAIQNDTRPASRRKKQASRLGNVGRGLGEWNYDLRAKVGVRKRDAFEVQMELWEYVGELIGEPWMPKWARQAHRLWRKGIIQAKNPQTAATRYDWALKKALYPKDATTTQLRAIDAKFAIVGSGIFAKLKSRRLLETDVVSENDIKKAMASPPKDTRAFVRGNLIRKYVGPKPRPGFRESYVDVGWGYVSANNVQHRHRFVNHHYNLKDVLCSSNVKPQIGNEI